MVIAVGNNKTCKKWKNRKIKWVDFVAELSTHIRTKETAAEYESMSKEEKDRAKDTKGFVGGYVLDGIRQKDHIKNRSLITIDLDNVKSDFKIYEHFQKMPYEAVIYSTHSHTKDRPRYRVVLPLGKPVPANSYESIARRIGQEIGIEMCDNTTFQVERLMYYPSCPYDSEPVFYHVHGEFVDAQIISQIDKQSVHQGDPYEKPGWIGAFCRAYSIEDAIDAFLSDRYEESLSGRYTYIDGTTTGGLVIYDEGKFAYSFHSTDPISGKLCNAFDLVRIHLFGHLDSNAKRELSCRPSQKAMIEFAQQDSITCAEYNNELSKQFDIDQEWARRLQLTPKGQIKPTIDNIIIILENDEKVKGNYYFDEFRKSYMVCADLPWARYKDRVSNIWNDSDDVGLRWYMEIYYGINNVRAIYDALDRAMMKRSTHPVKEYLESLKWDCTPRSESLFIDYMGAKDSDYTRAVTRCALIGAIARIYKPGCKHDHVLVLVGEQGCGKSTMLAKLGKSWFTDSLYTLAGKDAYEQIQGYWIIEMSEMAAARKADIERIKQFLASTSDNFRASYARRTQELPRQCAFFGTTNDDEFLRDYTGNRRFWPVDVKLTNLVFSITDELIDQIWAEALSWYVAGEKWHLSRQLEEKAKQIQEEHTEENSMKGQIERFLDMKLPKDWENMNLFERRMFIDTNMGLDKGSGVDTRYTVCAKEIWFELFGGDEKSYTQAKGRSINAILKKLPGWVYRPRVDCGRWYGRQRGFQRIFEVNISDDSIESILDELL